MFSYPKRPDRFWSPPSLLHPEIKRPVRVPDHSQLGQNIKISGTIIPLPPTPSWRGQIFYFLPLPLFKQRQLHHYVLISYHHGCRAIIRSQHAFLDRLNPHYTFKPSLFKIHFHINLQSTHESPSELVSRVFQSTL